MKKLSLVIVPLLILTLLLNGCVMFYPHRYDSNRYYDDYNDYNNNDHDYESDYDYSYDFDYDYESDYDYDYSYDFDYDYESDYDYDYNYDFDYDYGTTLSNFDGFWERTEGYAKCGIFIHDDLITIFVASIGEQYTFDVSTTLTIKQVGSSFYLYQGATKEGEIELIGNNALYLSGMESLNGLYDSVYMLDVELD